MEKVLRNCKPFVEVLAKAHGKKVQQWTLEHFQRATIWCVYFEKAYDMLVKMASKLHAVNQQLQLEASALPQPWPGPVALNVAFLQHCLSRLCAVLLTNEHTPKDLLPAVLQKAFSSHDIVAWAKEVVILMKDRDTLSRLDLEGLRSTLLGHLGPSRGPLPDNCDAVLMELLAHQLCTSLVPKGTEEFSGFSPEQEQALYQLVKIDIGLATILTACCCVSPSQTATPGTGGDSQPTADADPRPTRLASELMDWVLSCNLSVLSGDLDSHSGACHHHAALFCANATCLAHLAQTFDNFLDCYVQHLLRWTQFFVRVNFCNCSEWTLQAELFHWHFARPLLPLSMGSSDECSCPAELQHWHLLVASFKSLTRLMGGTRERVLQALVGQAHAHREQSLPPGQLQWKADFTSSVWEDIMEKVAMADWVGALSSC